MDPMLIVGAVIVAGALAVLIVFIGGLIGFGVFESRLVAGVPKPSWNEDTHRVLIVLTTDGIDEGICRSICDRSEPVEIRIAVPLTPNRIDYYLVGTDEAARPVAEQRLADALTHLMALGIVSSGSLGEVSTGPVEMIQDEAATFRPHEVVLVVHPEEDHSWMESTLAKDAMSRYDIPLTVMHSHSAAA